MPRGSSGQLGSACRQHANQQEHGTNPNEPPSACGTLLPKEQGAGHGHLCSTGRGLHTYLRAS